MEAYKDDILLNIRPAITLNKNTKIIGGDGSITFPYLVGTETYASRNMKVNKLDIGTSIEYSGYNYIVAGKEKDGTTKVIMASPFTSSAIDTNISYDTDSSIKIYNPNEKGNIAYQLNNVLSNYIDTNYFEKKDIIVPIYKEARNQGQIRLQQEEQNHHIHSHLWQGVHRLRVYTRLDNDPYIQF